MADVSKIKLPSGTTYNIKDDNALPLTGGSVTGPVSFGDSVSIDEATVGDLVVNGSASFTNNLQANTINGVTVGSDPKFTDTNTVTTATTTGSGNAVTAVTASNGALTITKGATFLTSHQDISGKADKATTLAGYGITDAKIASGVITLGSNTITPLTSSSTLSAAKLSGAIPSTVTATTQASTDNSTKIATTAYVTTAIANLPEPMVFKGSVGTGGTITSLPSAAASNEGHTYKVITALSSPSAKVGDTVISNGSSWVVIPSGDEPSGTVTSVAVSNGGGLSVSGSPVTSSGTITISHADTSSQASSSNSGRTYIQSLTLDTYGHVTGISTATETVTNTDNKLQVAEVTSGTLYYPIVGTGTAAATRQYDTTGFLYSSSTGTTNVIGSSTIILGNNTNSGVANNKQGVLCLYGTGTYGTCIVAGASTAARTLTLPDANGTVALTSDIPDVSGKIDTAGTGLSKSGTTLNHSNAVAAQSTQAIYPIKIDAQGHISAYGSAVTIPTVPSNIVNTITTTAGAHTAITSQKGNVSFNVPTTAAHVGAASSSHAHGNITNGGDITATAPTVANGDQIIINDHSASKITNGPTFDGSTTTKALTPKGTWETFASSDKQLEITELTDNDSGISYYPIVGRGNTSAIRQYDEAGFCYIPQEGTTANDGYATLILGNNITSGTAGNRQGELKLFDSTNYCGTLSTTSNHLTDIRHWYLPDKTGTIALVSDITAAISYPVTSVNSKTGAVSLTASDVGAVPTTRTVNSKALSSNISLTAADVSAVPTTRKVNNKALSSDITLSASDVSAVPTTRTVNSKALSANITLTSSDVNAVDKTNPLYDLDTSAASGDDADLYTALSNLGWNNSSYGIITS